MRRVGKYLTPVARFFRGLGATWHKTRRYFFLFPLLPLEYQYINCMKYKLFPDFIHIDQKPYDVQFF